MRKLTAVEINDIRKMCSRNSKSYNFRNIHISAEGIKNYTVVTLIRKRGRGFEVHSGVAKLCPKDFKSFAKADVGIKKAFERAAKKMIKVKDNQSGYSFYDANIKSREKIRRYNEIGELSV